MKLKSKKSALLMSFTSLLLCFAMLAGSTFAWFTDTATTGVNKIVSGKLDVDIVDENNNSLDGKSLSFKNANGEDDILWEPGATFFTQGFKIVNKGNLALKYKVVVSGTTGDAKLLEAIKFDVVTEKDKAVAAALTEEGGLLPNGASAPAAVNTYYYLRGHMNETANNDYQDLSLNGISITVYATQDTVEYDSFNNTYDEKAGKDTAFYSLAEFNALTEIPEGVKTVYVNIGNTSVTGYSKCTTIGNYSLSDEYMWVKDGETAPEGYTATERQNAQNNATAYRTNKDGITVHVLGSLTMENYDNGSFSGFQTLCFQLPEKSTVILENMTLNGSFNISGSYTYMYNLPNGDIGHQQNPKPEGYTNVWYGFPFVIENIKLSNCTINGQWFANGNVAKNVEINSCTFNDYQNKTANWGNPIWWKNAPATNLTIDGCDITSTRPMKVGEGGIGAVTITNNVFTMRDGDKYTKDSSDKVKNTALSLGNKITGDVEIKGNTVNGPATALISLLDVNMTMPEGKTFTVSNEAEGVKTSVEWKKNIEITPDFVK